MIINKTGQELFQLIQGLNNQSLLTIRNTKLQYSVFKTRQELFKFHKEFLKGFDQDPRFQSYQDELDRSIKDYRIENPEVGGNAAPVDNKFELLKEAVITKYKDVIDKENSRVNSLNEKATKEFEIEIFGIKYEDLPDDLTAEQINIISYLLI